MQKTNDKIIRTPKTWMVYLLLSLYAYCLNIPGPITGYLRDEFQMNYTSSSLHFSAFALGILVAGLVSGPFIQRMGHWRGMGIGAVGLGIGGLVLSFGKVPALTIAGIFLMGLIGTLILAIYPVVLEEEMKAGSPVGISEANMISSIFASLAPLLVGYLAGQVAGWRMAVIVVAVISLALGIGLTLSAAKYEKVRIKQPEVASAKGKMPKLYWVYWLALVLGISIEFCTIYWGADFIEKILGLSKDSATQAVSLFLIGMIVGRFFGGKLLQRTSARNILVGAILVGLAGFGLFWTGLTPGLGLIGLTMMGLGVANLYPTILALMMHSAGEFKGLAGALATLASGTAIFFLPMILGSLADQTGIKRAFLIVLGLFALLGVVLLVAAQMQKQDQNIKQKNPEKN